MATAKVLQTPQIVEIIGSTLRIKHPSIHGNVKTYLRSPIEASGTAMSVADNSSFDDNDWMIVGTIGDSTTEEVDVNGAVTLGSSITVTDSLKFGHEVDAEVTKIFERGIKIYGASSDGGSGTLIASVDAITTPIADAVPIQWDKPYTECTLISTDTADAYYFVKFTDGTTDSPASAYVPSSGVLYTAVESFIQQALDITDSELDDKSLTRDMCVRWANDAQNFITQFVYQDLQTGKLVQKDWSWEVTEDKTSIALTENENSYALSALTPDIKYPYSDKGVVNVRIGKFKPLKQIKIDEYDNMMANKPRTTVATQPSVGATSLVLADTYELPENGTIYVGGDIVTYTGNTQATGTLTGIPVSGTGSITEAHAVGTVVWQNVSPGLPSCYTVFNGYLLLDKPIHEDYVGQKLKVRYFSSIPRLTTIASTTPVPFTNVFHWYIASQIEKRKVNMEIAGAHMEEFKKQVLANAQADIIPQTDSYTYFNFEDPFDAVNEDANSYHQFT